MLSEIPKSKELELVFEDGLKIKIWGKGITRFGIQPNKNIRLICALYK